MDSVARIYVAWELKQAGKRAAYIAERVRVNRATVYRWLRGIRQEVIRGFVQEYRRAKKGHRHRQTAHHIQQRVLANRREHHECCGEKVVYWLRQENIRLSSSVYRILNKHLWLRSKGHKNSRRGPLPQASGPREVIQMDSIDFGTVFAFSAIDTFTREGRVVLQPGVTAQHGAAALRELMAAQSSGQTSRDWSRFTLSTIALLALTRKTSKPSSNASTAPSARNVWAGSSMPQTTSLPFNLSLMLGWITIILSDPAWLSHPCVPLYLWSRI